MLHEDMKFHFEGFPPHAHPMAILSAMINACGCYDLSLLSMEGEESKFDIQAAQLISQVRTIAAFSYRKSKGLPINYPKKTYKYSANFLHMMFSDPYEDYELKPEVVRGAGSHFHAPRGPRAELLDLDGAHGGLEPGKLVCLGGGGCVRAVGAAARRSESSRARDAGGDSPERRRRLEVHRGREGQDQRQAVDGLRPSRLQKSRSAREDHQTAMRQAARGAEDRRSLAGHRPPLEEAALGEDYFIERKLYRTSISTAASSCARWAFRRRCSP